METDQPTPVGNSRLTVLSEAERTALYGLPDFDDFQRAEFLAFTDAERALAERRTGPVEHLHCLLQMGYFKAKNAFFNLSAQAVPPEDVVFLVERYLPGSPVTLQPLTDYEQYTQRAEIAKLFGYRLWSGTDRPTLVETAALLARRDVTPTFVLIEVLAFLKTRKIVRPGYTTLQSIITDALSAERRRLGQLIEGGLDADTNAALRKLLVREDTLSELAALRQDAKNFRYRMMTAERLQPTKQREAEGLERTTLTRTWQRRRVVEHLAGMTERLGSLVHEQGAALEALGRFVPAVREVASRALVAMQPVLQYVVGQMHERQRQQAVEQQHEEQEEHTLQPSRGLGLGM